MEKKIALIEQCIISFPDFPKKGVLYRDLFSALADGAACKALKEILVSYIRQNFPDAEMIVGLESRGFLFCFAIAAELGIACMPIRKQGKLPGSVLSQSYDLEYGSAVFEIQKDYISKPGLKCIVIDDLIATGGSMEAAITLLNQTGCNVLGCMAVIELLELNGRKKLSNVAVHSLIKY